MLLEDIFINQRKYDRGALKPTLFLKGDSVFL